MENAKIEKLKWDHFFIFKHREFEDRSCRGPRHLPLSWIFCSNYLSPVSNALEQSPWTNECIFFFLFQRALKQWLLHFFLSTRSLAVCQLLLFSRRREKHLIFWSKIVQRKLNELFLWKRKGEILFGSTVGKNWEKLTINILPWVSQKDCLVEIIKDYNYYKCISKYE